MGEFDGNVSYLGEENRVQGLPMLPLAPKHKPLPQIEDDYEKSDRLSFWIGFFVCIFIIGTLTLGGITVYYVKEGKFNSEIVQGDINLEPEINTPVEVKNDYQFNPSNDYHNYFNVTVVIENVDLNGG